MAEPEPAQLNHRSECHEPEVSTGGGDPLDGLALERLVRIVEKLRADREADRTLLDELLAEVAHPGSRTRARQPVYPDWQAWVDGWLTARISRHPHRIRWCHHYAEHAEVADRLEALWHAWEDQWPDPLARLTWYRDGLDHQLAIITAEDGPLRECSAHEHQHVPAPTLARLGCSPGSDDHPGAVAARPGTLAR